MTEWLPTFGFKDVNIRDIVENPFPYNREGADRGPMAATENN